MSYLVLARKYRPRDFDSVVGQEDLTEVLRGAIRDERVGHAYLFCGPRGTGKTTTARIFAKALNCEQGPTANPCGVCERCNAADEGRELDIIEIDAASHTGVDYVRTLRDEAAYAPMVARYKIYLIDEVHMLSKAAFNALLKTLEEPPPHVKFLFATTEPQKLLDTVLSRCQILRLAPISEVQIAARLDYVMGQEGFTPDPGVSIEVARLARGGMRDALSMTDQLIALAGTSPTIADVARLGGEGGIQELDHLLTLVETKQRAEILNALPMREGAERDYLGRLLSHLRQALVMSLCGAESQLVEASAEERGVMAARAKRLGTDRLQVWLEELLYARERMRTLPNQARMILEVALLDLARPGGDMPLAELAARIERLEARLKQAAPPNPNGAVPSAAAAPPSPASPRPPVAKAPPLADAPPAKPSMLRRDTSPDALPVRAAQPTPTPQPEPLDDLTNLAGVWKAALDLFKVRNGEAARLLHRVARLETLEDRGNHLIARLVTRPLPPHDQAVLENSRLQSALARALSEATSRETTVQLSFGESVVRQTDLPNDDFVDEVVRLFGGTVERH